MSQEVAETTLAPPDAHSPTTTEETPTGEGKEAPGMESEAEDVLSPAPGDAGYGFEAQRSSTESPPTPPAGDMDSRLSDPVPNRHRRPPVTAGMWRAICEQYEHVKAAMRDYNSAKIEASSCRKYLDQAQARLGTLIEQAERGQTELFDVGAPVVSTGEGVAAPAGEQAPLFAGGEGEQPTEPESQDDPEGDPASHEATQDSEE